MRRILSTAVSALVIAALAGIPSGAVAQSEPADDPISPARVVRGLNADKIDGKHASRYTLSRRPRAKKLVATNRLGMLPPNIIQPFWRLVQGKPAWLADNQIHWDEIVGKPATMLFGTVNCTADASAVPVGGIYVYFKNLPREAMYDFQVVPYGDVGVYIEKAEEWTRNEDDGQLEVAIKVEPQTAAHCNIRASAQFGEGVTPAKAKATKNRLSKTNVRYKRSLR